MSDEQAPALLQIEQGIGQRLARPVGDQHTVVARGQRTLSDRAVVVEDVVDEAGAAGGSHELGLETDQSARGDDVVESHAAFAIRDHVAQLAAPLAEFFHHLALARFLDIDGQGLERLAFLSVDFLDDHLRA